MGIRDFGERRRVPGLRRDELARLAVVGLSYCTRLEQGGSLNASPEVLEALARALGLDEVERAHLHDLAAAPRRTTTRRGHAPERIGDATRQLVDAFGDTPALGRRSDVLAWNRTGHALFAGRLAPHTRTGRPAPGHGAPGLPGCAHPGAVRGLADEGQERGRQAPARRRTTPR
ncbi:helix-turn-helix domain-containing protein [Streptomyces sp. SAS_260]|uniref:helix-turn-helix domain-containing protein n=1 Tax=Streptomyces sp. SAS_260 TaxID=3412751 RepID=UPI00403D1A35